MRSAQRQELRYGPELPRLARVDVRVGSDSFDGGRLDEAWVPLHAEARAELSVDAGEAF